MSSIEPCVKADLIQEFAGKSNVTTNSTKHTTDLSGTSFQVGAGVTARINDRVLIYAEADYLSGSKIKNQVKGDLGLRINW